MKPVSEPSLLSPKQRRSADRLEAILAAAERIVSEGGASALTMRALGRASGTPQGSLYQYAPSVVAVLQALADRYAARIAAALAAALARLPSADPPTPDALIATVVEDLAEAYASMPAYRELRLALARDPIAAEIENRLDRTIVEMLAPVVVTLDGGALADDGKRTVRALIEIGDAMLGRSLAPDDAKRAVIDARWAMVGYLRMAIDANGRSKGEVE